MSNIFFLIAETIADARDGAKEPAIRRWQSPLSMKSISRSLVGLKTVQDTPAQMGLRILLHKLFARNPDASDDVDPNEKLQSILGSEEGEADPQGF